MKTIIALIICMLIIGCGKKENKPVRIDVNRDGTFLLDSKPSSKNQLEEYIAKKRKENFSLKVVVIADNSTPYAIVEPVVLSATKAQAWWFCFKLTDSQNIEECITDSVVGDGPPTKEVRVDISDNLIFIDNKEISLADVKQLFSKRPKKDWGYNVFILCSGKTTFGNLFRFLEVCNQYEYVSPELQVMDKIY